MSTTRSTPSESPEFPEIWSNILKDEVEKDDPLWKEYLDKAAAFDVRMVDEWNKIVDVLLVYVALFISVLTSFIAHAAPFKRNPSDITNDLLVAIYYQLAAQSNNISIIPVDPRSYFSQSEADYDTAVSQNALLYISLSLSIIVSVIALAAKLWLVSYSRQVFSVGSPYDRAMKRQEAYNGVLVWNMEGVINILPVILLIALYLFGIYVYTSVWAVHYTIGNAIGVLLSLGMMFLGFTSLGAAFVSGCPFCSPFSGVIRSHFEIVQAISNWIPCELPSSKRFRWLWIGPLTLLWIASDAAVAYATSISGTWFSLFFFLAGIPIAYSTLQKADHKPQKYKIPRLGATVLFSVSLSIILAVYFDNTISIPLYTTAVLGVIVSACWMLSKMSKSMAETGEIDAIAWLLITTPPEDPATFFKKAGQMTGFKSTGRHYRARLLESLMPLLTPLITSYHAPEVPVHHRSDTHSPQSDDILNGRPRTSPSQNLVNDNTVAVSKDPHLKKLEIYIACLARLSDFADDKGTFWCLREDAKQHPKLEQPLIDKLVELANSQLYHQVDMKAAASKVLDNYKLNKEGNPLENPTTVLESVATDPTSEATPMLNDSDLNTSQEQRRPDPAAHAEPAHSVLESVATVPRSAATTLMLHDSGLNSQKQGHSELYRPVDPAMRVEAELEEIELEDVLDVNSEI